jgi:hypothetical protein
VEYLVEFLLELDEVGEHDATRVVRPRLDEAAAGSLGVGLVRLELADSSVGGEETTASRIHPAPFLVGQQRIPH